MAFVAPAGSTLSLADVARGGVRSLAPGALDRLSSQLADASSRRSVRLVSTGRAGMALALQAMQRAARDPRRREVVFAGYTCYSVPGSVERAGLVPRICDVDPATLSFDLDALAGIDFSRVLAIVSANLYGLPNELDELEEMLKLISVYRWLALKFPAAFTDVPRVELLRRQATEQTQAILRRNWARQGLSRRECTRCGRALLPSSPHRVCRECDA